MSDRGIALVVTTLAIALVGALGAAVVLATTSEAHIAARFRTSEEALYAADAAAEWALADLSNAADWAAVAGGAVVSTFVDGAARGTRTIVDGSVVDLDAVRARNVPSHLYGYGRLADLVAPADRASLFYVMVFVAADPLEPDRLNVHAEAFGPRGAHHVVAVNLSRQPAGARLESWAEIR
jgi:hypothetical protein